MTDVQLPLWILKKPKLIVIMIVSSNIAHFKTACHQNSSIPSLEPCDPEFSEKMSKLSELDDLSSYYYYICFF